MCWIHPQMCINWNSSSIYFIFYWSIVELQCCVYLCYTVSDSEIMVLNADIRKEEIPKIHDIRKQLEKLGKGEQRKSNIISKKDNVSFRRNGRQTNNRVD